MNITYKGDFAEALKDYLHGIERISTILAKQEKSKELLVMLSIMNENIANLVSQTQKDL